MESSNPCVGPLPRVKLSLPLLYGDDLISAAELMTFFLMLPSVKITRKIARMKSYVAAAIFPFFWIKILI